MIRVVIIEDQRDIREGLCELIDRVEGFRCCATFASMEQVWPAIAANLPDLALVDIGLPGASGTQYELTPHEQRLLKLLVEGHNYKTAAADLGRQHHLVSHASDFTRSCTCTRNPKQSPRCCGTTAYGAGFIRSRFQPAPSS